jgi:HK97 family phage prohead protease
MTQLEIEFRHQADLGVSFPKRQIELVVMPYETEAHVQHRGRTIREIVSRGAFQALDADHRRINVNRGHVLDDIVGHAIRFHPSRDEGLVAELSIVNTQLGTDTLELADKGYLRASAGFGVPDGGETWPERTLRRLSRIWLDHIAMTPNPAYDGAEVLDVRDMNPGILEPVAATPFLDEVRGWDLADRYAILGLTT